jgi:hypothetical protein
LIKSDDGLDYIYYGALAAMAYGLLQMLSFIAVGAGAFQASVVLGVLAELSFIAFGGLWFYGFSLHRAHVRQMTTGRWS